MASIDNFPDHDLPEFRAGPGDTWIDDWDERCASEKRRVHHRPLSYAQIQNCAKTSCRICDAFEKVILAVVDGCLPGLFPGPRDKAEGAMILDKLVVGPDTDGLSIVDQEHLMRIGLMDRWLDVELFRDAEEQTEFRVSGIGFPQQPRYGPATGSERGFRRARQWLRECSEHHSCKEPGPVLCPRKLLDLRRDQIRLFETDRITDFNEPYVCLSHRWGDPQYKRLTSTVQTIQNHMRGIPWDDLPKTFQDAVIIRRHMSVSYLWIDSLCILQEYDSMTAEEAQKTSTDFARENSAMANIYRNSFFTISATISTSMASGIFCKKPFNSHQIKVTDDSGNDAFFRVREKTSRLTPPTDLETRGWTFQENLLPSRDFGFGPFDLSWRCKESYTCECGHITTRVKINVDQREKLAMQAQLPHQGGAKTQEWWAWLVQLYSARNLTNEQDKLPALSGLAQVYHEATSDTYLAGLWKASLPHGLCWYNLRGTRARGDPPIKPGIGRRPRAFRSPSWSWASIDNLDDATCRFWRSGDRTINPLRTQHEAPQATCTVYEVACQPKAEDAFGAVRDGFIEIGTTLISATIDTETAPAFHGYFYDSLAWTLSHVEEGNEVDFCLADCALGDDGLKQGDAVHCAPILEDLSVTGSRRGCLVLKRLQGQTYRRVGFCILEQKEPEPRRDRILGEGMGPLFPRSKRPGVCRQRTRNAVRRRKSA